MNKKVVNVFSLMIVGAFLLSACEGTLPAETAGTASVVTQEESLATEEVAAVVTQIATETAAVIATGEPPSAGNSASEPPSGTPPAGSPGETKPDGQPPAGDPPDGGQGGNPPGGGGQNGGGQGGNPPGGGAGGNPPSGGGASGGSSSSSANLLGAYVVDGKTLTETGKTYNATGEDESAIYVLNAGRLTLSDATITSSGDSSSSDNSSFYGQNAGVLVTSNSSAEISDSTVYTTGDGANGVFASGDGAVVTLSNSTIDCLGQYAHAVMATLGGTLIVTNVDMNTAGKSSGAIATDRGSGTITVTGGTIKTTGDSSPAIYSTGEITVSNAVLTSTGSEVAVIEGANSITINNSQSTSSFEGKGGVMIYQSMSGDAEGNQGVFTITGGSLSYTAATGPLFYVTNSTGLINLNNVDLSTASGVLVSASANRWGTEGSNGGTVILTANQQELNGNLTADSISTLTLSLTNGSVLTGAIDAAQTAKSASLTLDATSSWTVTGDSHLTTLSGAKISGTSITNITGNGFTVTYNSASNPSLGGKTYTLAGGGTLKPAN